MFPVQKFLLLGTTEEDLTMQAVMFLASRGIVVSMPGEWETRDEFCARVGISPRHFSRVIRSKWAPQVTRETGETGRLIRLRSTPEFDAYARKRSRQRIGQLLQRSGQLEAMKHGRPHCQVQQLS